MNLVRLSYKRKEKTFSGCRTGKIVGGRYGRLPPKKKQRLIEKIETMFKRDSLAKLDQKIETALVRIFPRWHMSSTTTVASAKTGNGVSGVCFAGVA